MKQSFLKRDLPIVWLPIVLVLCAAVVIVFKAAFLDPPPTNSVLITAGSVASAAKATDGTGSTPTSQVKTPSAIQTPESASAQTPSALATQVMNLSSDPPTNSSLPQATAIAVQPTPTIELIAVYVSGAVQRPGVYTLPIGSRVNDALSAAGGPADQANLDALNLAARLSDEDHILVPHVGDTPIPATGAANPQRSPTPKARQSQSPVAGRQPSATRSAPQQNPAPVGKVNINTASEQELESLPGIGPALAARIVADREANGLYQTPEDLMRVPGIKSALFGKLRDQITVK